MKREGVNQMAHGMVWSIFEDTSIDYDNWVEDRTAVVDGEKLADGWYHVKYVRDNAAHTADCEVRDGKWTEFSDKMIGSAVERAGYWGVYIEGFKRHNEGFIEVVIGS